MNAEGENAVAVSHEVQADMDPVRVSVVIPCRNEERFIGKTLESILGGTYPPSKMEVLVVDGASSDRTRAIVSDIARVDRRIRLLDNPRGLTPVALNIGIRAARGEIVIRVDSHSTYPPHYVAALVHTLELTGADMVGGCVENVPADERLITKAIALATGSAFGTGSCFRYVKKDGPVDAVQLGCWRREVFDRVGFFDERLIRNQDNEHSSRILNGGGRVYMTSDVTIRYHPRSSLRQLWRQASVTGMWNAFTERLHPYAFRWRHVLPGLFFIAVVLAALLIAAGQFVDERMALIGTAVLAPYAMANVVASTGIGIRERQLTLAPVVAFVFFLYHFAYGFGIAKGWALVMSGHWEDRLGGATKEARLS